MESLTFKVKTKSFGADDLVQLAVRYDGAWHHLVLKDEEEGRIARIDISGEVRSVDVAVQVNGPAFGTVKVTCRVPSRSVLPVADFTIAANEANISKRVHWTLQW